MSWCEVVIRFDDGEKEERDWPAKNIAVDNDENNEEEKEKKALTTCAELKDVNTRLKKPVVLEPIKQ